MAEINHIDTETISMLQEIMEDGFEPLLQSYFEDSQTRLSELRDALAAQDAESVRRTAHSLKGSSGNVGASHMVELCLIVEERGKEGNLDGIDTLVDDIEQAFQQVKELMGEYIS